MTTWTPNLYPLDHLWDQAAYNAAYKLLSVSHPYVPGPAPELTFEYIDAASDILRAQQPLHGISLTALGTATPAHLSLARWNDFREFYPTDNYIAEMSAAIEEADINIDYLVKIQGVMDNWTYDLFGGAFTGLVGM